MELQLHKTTFCNIIYDRVVHWHWTVGSGRCLSWWELWVLLLLLIDSELLNRLKALVTDRWDKFTHALLL